jgi:hypothetical protein
LLSGFLFFSVLLQGHPTTDPEHFFSFIHTTWLYQPLQMMNGPGSLTLSISWRLLGNTGVAPPGHKAGQEWASSGQTPWNITIMHFCFCVSHEVLLSSSTRCPLSFPSPHVQRMLISQPNSSSWHLWILQDLIFSLSFVFFFNLKILTYPIAPFPCLQI